MERGVCEVGIWEGSGGWHVECCFRSLNGMEKSDGT